jgi:hypothetical protein
VCSLDSAICLGVNRCRVKTPKANQQVPLPPPLIPEPASAIVYNVPHQRQPRPATSKMTSLPSSAMIYSSSPPPTRQQSSSDQSNRSSQRITVPAGLAVYYGQVLYNAEKDRRFRRWWSQTTYAMAIMEETQGFNDPDWGASGRRSDARQYFIEAANIKSGEPSIFCLCCERKLVHPISPGCSAGNMKNHLKTQSCLCRPMERRLPDMPIQKSNEASFL